MKRANYYNYIEEKLHTLAHRITTGGKLNMLSLHLHSESFYQHFFNLLYGYNLVNLNQESQNVEAIDLIDRDEKIVIQVSSTATKVKIEGALSKNSIADYSNYVFKFISIAKDASTLRIKDYDNPHSIGFEPSRDIYDIASILSEIYSLDIDKLERVYEFIQKELGNNRSKLNPNLTIKLGKSTIIGRKKELQEIKEHLNNSNALLVNSIGGMGKSTISSYYLHRHKNEFDYYGFFEGLDDFVNKLEIALNLQIEQGQDRLTVVLHELTKLEGNKLLVIDNIQEVSENKKIIEKILDLKEHEGFKILLTSREEIEGIDNYLLETLSMCDAKELFNSIYKVEDEVLLEEVLEYLDCHAFFVEKTAMSIKKTLTPQIIKDKFENGDFSKISVKRKENFNKYLNELFTLDGLDKEEVLMLKQFSVLPSIEIDFPLLQKIFSQNDSSFEELLDYLCEQGWLIKNDGRYKLHQIIKEFILSNYTPMILDIEQVKSFFYSIMGSFKSKNISKNDNFILHFESLIYFFKRIDHKDEDVIDFLNGLGVMYEQFGFYEKALNTFENGIEIHKKLSKSYIDVSYIYQNIGSLYETLGKYKLSYNFYKKALQISMKKFTLTSKENQVAFTNLAHLYQSEGKFKKALPIYRKLLKLNSKNYSAQTMLGELYNKTEQYTKAKYYTWKSIILAEDFFGKEHVTTAICYNNYAQTCRGLKDYTEAMNYYTKSLKINEKYLGEHLETATNYNNIANLYEIDNKLEKALFFRKKALKIRIELLEPYHPETALYYFNLGALYYLLKDYTKTFEMFQSYLKSSDNSINKNDTDLFFVHHFLAVAYNDLKKYQESYFHCKEAVKSGKIIFKEDDSRLIDEKKALEFLKNKLLEECLSEMKPIFL